MVNKNPAAKIPDLFDFAKPKRLKEQYDFFVGHGLSQVYNLKKYSILNDQLLL